jgi:hypothetical protein
MDTSLSLFVTSKSGTDMMVSCDRVTELFIHHKTQSFVGPEGGLSIGIKSSRKIIEQLLNELEMYHECVTEANAQLRNKMKASMGIKGQFIPTDGQKDIEICASTIIPAYNNMVGAIIFRAHKLKMKLTDDLSFSMQYSRIIENAVQSSIAVTNQLLDFSLLIRPQFLSTIYLSSSVFILSYQYVKWFLLL